MTRKDNKDKKVVDNKEKTRYTIEDLVRKFNKAHKVDKKPKRK